jgi:hypothetical protein
MEHNTYQYARKYKPEPFDRKYKVARRVIKLDEELGSSGKKLNAAKGGSIANRDNIPVRVRDSGGTSAEYLTRRKITVSL